MQTRIFCVLVVALGGAACSTEDTRPVLADVARREAPVPACVRALATSNATIEPGVTRALRTFEMWALLFPSFDLKANAIAPDALACTQRPVLRDPVLADPALSSHEPLVVNDEDRSLGGGFDGLRAVWLYPFHYADGTVGGPLALYRGFEGYGEVYGVGAFRGHADRTHLALERVGLDLVVLVSDDGCSNHRPGVACDSLMKAFMLRRGTLQSVADFSTERIAYATGFEPGVSGRVEYHLTSVPSFGDGILRVLEQVRVIDPGGRTIRKAELERRFPVVPDTPNPTAVGPLWPQVYPAANAPSSNAEDEGEEPLEPAPRVRSKKTSGKHSSR